MSKLVRHSFEVLSPITVTSPLTMVRDGDFDAVETVVFIPEASQNYMIYHGLGRPVTRVSIEMKSQPCDYGWVLDKQGVWLNDSEKVGLWFSVAQCIIRLRLA